MAMNMMNNGIMSASLHACLTYESGMGLEYEDFPLTEEPVYILGQCYSALYDRDELKNDILSRLWFTYRKGFSNIGGTGPTSDSGWGCMLRCGQMMLAHTLIVRHLGREWRWNAKAPNEIYQKILSLFQDSKGALYSIHQIASMGVSEGKAVGQWFGPNTIAQVVKKLAVYDEWSNISVHVALDNTVIIDDVKLMCRSHPNTPDDLIVNHTVDTAGKSLIKSFQNESTNSGHIAENGANKSWRPLLLIIPLRLGLSEMNTVYTESLKICFRLRQSVGIIGGKPNHAHWFIGNVGEELVYLDPHTTQPLSPDSDSSNHCVYSSRMKISQLDPSIAVGFFCETEDDFDMLCRELLKNVVHSKSTPMFELHQTRPRHWPPFEPYPDTSGTKEAYTVVEDRHYDSEEEFELLG